MPTTQGLARQAQRCAQEDVERTLHPAPATGSTQCQVNAYAFGKIASIMGIAAIAAFAGAVLLLILSAHGLAHERRAAPEAEVFPKLATPAKISAS
jgi:hypothetical protein